MVVLPLMTAQLDYCNTHMELPLKTCGAFVAVGAEYGGLHGHWSLAVWTTALAASFAAHLILHPLQGFDL